LGNNPKIRKMKEIINEKRKIQKIRKMKKIKISNEKHL
jgi:hypothetical protein